MTSPFLSDDARAAVLDRLGDVRREHGVAIPLAVESGSRAWGFPSPDSDYDCRFVYVRPAPDYLDPWPPRDVIETPLDAVLDVNGWDLVKAVRLAVKGNATLLEWVSSRLVYIVDEAFRTELAGFAEEVADRGSLVQHYAHVAAAQRGLWPGGDVASLKKVFYAVRPAAALRWLREHPDRALAPIELDVLLAESGAAQDVIAAARDLTARKARTRELGAGPVPVPLRRFVDEELARVPGPGVPEGVEDRRRLAADWFRSAVRRFAPA